MAVWRIGLCALCLLSTCGSDDVPSADGSAAPRDIIGSEGRPRTPLETEKYHLRPYDSGCFLLPWSSTFTILIRMLTNNPKDHSFYKDMSIEPERMSTYLAEYQPSTKFILLFARFAWVIVALVGVVVIGARFANYCGGERRQVVDDTYMFYYSGLLPVTQGVAILAVCGFVILAVSHQGISSSVVKAPDYFANALHDLRVYTNRTTEELSLLTRRAVNIVSLKGFIAYANRSNTNWTEGELRQAWAATQPERRRADKLLVDMPDYNADTGRAAKELKGTFTEQGIAKIEQRFRWFDEMTGVWDYYAHPILRPAAVYLLLIAAVVAAVGTAIGHLYHSEQEDPVKRKLISDVAGHMLLAATFLMFLFSVAALRVIKNSTPHAIAGQCYVCDQYAKKDYDQLQHAQDMLWPVNERADTYKSMYVGDVLQHCSGEGVSIDFFIKRNKAISKGTAEKPEGAKPRGFGGLFSTRFRCEAVAALSMQNDAKLLLWAQYGARLYNRRATTSTTALFGDLQTPTYAHRIDELMTLARRYYFCSILEHRSSFSIQQKPAREASRVEMMAAGSFGPGMCSPVFGIVKTGLSLFCDCFLEYLKSMILTLFLAVLLLFVGMPTLLMLSKYYLIMLPPRPEPVKTSPAAQRPKKERSGPADSPSGDAGGIVEGSSPSRMYGAADGMLAHGGRGRAVARRRAGIESSSGSQRDSDRRLPKRISDGTDLTKGLGELGTPMLPKAPDTLFSAGALFDIHSSDSGDSSDIIVPPTGPAISIKNVMTTYEADGHVVDTREILIPMSRLKREQESLTSSSAESFAPKKCSVDILWTSSSSDCSAGGRKSGQRVTDTLSDPSSELGAHSPNKPASSPRGAEGLHGK